MAKKNGDDDKMPWTPPQDPRFQSTNVERYCYQMYIDYHRCTRLLGTGHKPCDYFKQCYTRLCFNDWINRWDEQIKKGTFAGELPDAPPPKKK